MRLRRPSIAGLFGRTSSAVLLAGPALAVLLGGLASLSAAGKSANEREIGAERDRVSSALVAARTVTAEAVARLAAGPLMAKPPAAASGGENGGLDQVLLVDRASPRRAERLDGSRPPGTDLGPSAVRLAEAADTSGHASELLPVAGDVYDAAAAPVAASPIAAGQGTAPATLVGVRRLDAAYLGAIARAASVDQLRMVRVGDAAAAPGEPFGFGDFTLSWDVARPGDALVARWSAALVLLTAAVAVLITLRARRAATELQAREARAVEASRNDWLSGLPHRACFDDALDRELARAGETGRPLALFHLDIDRFKDLNSTFGITAGDALIQELTRRLSGVLRPGQSLARFEGDAFLILCPDLAAPGDRDRVAAAIQAAVDAPFDVGGFPVIATLSIGVALAPKDAATRGDLMRCAGLALDHAQGEGGDRLCVYRAALETAWRNRTAIEREFRDAIATDALALHFQPIVDVRTGAIVCAEALVRWQHPTEGVIPPDRFVAFAEARGLILPLGEWVLREACRAAARWEGPRVAVNVSPLQIRRRDFVDLVFQVLAETGLDPDRLELELTEGVLLDHGPDVLDAMAALRARGIRLALDDFGTGYSSLIYLRRFAIDKIKIDKAFVDAIEPGSESAILVESVIRLGQALGLTVTAEGVETAAQRDLLVSLGCHQLQGYLLGRPLSGPAFAATLAAECEAAERSVA